MLLVVLKYTFGINVTQNLFLIMLKLYSPGNS